MTEVRSRTREKGGIISRFYQLRLPPMPPRFIDRFEVILLDMVRTFMFDADRFSVADDFAATYRRIGGHTLSDGEGRQSISSVFDTMLGGFSDSPLSRSVSIRSQLPGDSPAVEGAASTRVRIAGTRFRPA